MIEPARRLAERLCAALGGPPLPVPTTAGDPPVADDAAPAPAADPTPAPAPAPADTIRARFDAHSAADVAAARSAKAATDSRIHLVTGLRLVGHPVVLRGDDGSFRVLALDGMGTGYTVTDAADSGVAVPAPAPAPTPPTA